MAKYVYPLWAECPECGHQIKFVLPEDIAELEAEVVRLRKSNKLLHDATIVLRNGMGGHNHWDATQKQGAGCGICQQQQAARDEAIRLIEQAALAAEEPE